MNSKRKKYTGQKHYRDIQLRNDGEILDGLVNDVKFKCLNAIYSDRFYKTPSRNKIWLFISRFAQKTVLFESITVLP